ncbi:MAG TPA: hypothetical protein VNA17_08635, partial [Pyrinomonadaceae bacterium]|nr:hypothetical protein [Pyrinomonadaceae bacterium]
MGPIIFAAIIVILAAWPPNIGAQSARTDKSTDGKKNQRHAEPTPTPKPVGTQPPDQSTAADDGDIIRVATNLISVPVRVMDKGGRFVG